MHYFVYKTTNRINGRYYIGVHSTRKINDGYLGSGSLLKKAIEKYGPENFSREVLREFPSYEDAVKYEAELVTEEFVKSDDNYNLALGGNSRSMPGENNPFYGKTHSAETKKIISEKASGRIPVTNPIIVKGTVCGNQVEALELLGISSRILLFDMIGNPDFPEVHYQNAELQKKAKEAFERKSLRKEENLARLAAECSKRFSGVPKSAEQKEKISASNVGKKHSAEWVDKINKNPDKIRKSAEKHRGMKRSESARNKMSAAKKGRKPNNAGKKVYVDPSGAERKYFIAGNEPAGWCQVYPTQK